MFNKKFLIIIWILLIYCNTIAESAVNIATNSEKKIKLNFQDAELKNVLNYITDEFNLTFLPDDAVVTDKKVKGIKDIKITFTTNKPFNRKQVLDFLDVILEVSGLASIPMPDSNNFFRITNIAESKKTYLPTYISTNIKELPDQGIIRYLYFSQNRPINQIKEIIEKLQSKNAQINIFPESNAIIIMDEAYNVKSLLNIITELDTLDSPEILSIIKLKNSDVNEVLKIYESLKGKNETPRFFEDKKSGKLMQETKLIADNRTNSLILFGPKNEVKKIEKFIIEHIDIELNQIKPNIHVYKLNYASAEQVAKILNSVAQYGAGSEAAKNSGIRSGEQYISNLYFEPDKFGNNLIIKGSLKEYNLVRNTIEQLDKPQPQVALEVYIVSVDLTDKKALRSQIRNKNLNKLNYQWVGDQSVVVDQTTGSLVGNLISLATNFGSGTTLISLGKSDVWALLAILQEKTKSNIINNPFIIASNGTAANISVGSTRRVTTSQITSTGTTQDSFGTAEANLKIKILPQINSYGIINLNIEILIEQFTSLDVLLPDKSINQVLTKIKVADGESIAIGGLIMKNSSQSSSGIPVLSKIPIIGNLFGAKASNIENNHIMIFVSPKIIYNTHKNSMNSFTRKKTNDINNVLVETQSLQNIRDPINRWFFNEPNNDLRKMFGSFIDNRDQIQKNQNINKPLKKSKIIASVNPQKTLVPLVKD